nr:FAD-dependent oxidoreductase [Clostridiales bacterium]
MYNADLVIIGCGAVGSAIAREFSRFNIKVMVVEKNNDLYGDASRANGSISSPGYGNPPGSLVSRLSHASRNKYEIISRDLEIPYVRRGTVQPAFNEDMMTRLNTRLEYAWKNGDYEVERISREQLLDMEPTINPKVLGGLYSPRDSAVDDFQLVIAQAENAAENGVEFLLGAKVTDIEVSNGKIDTVKTTKGDIKTRYVINAAGLHNDDISKVVGGEIGYVVKPCKGQY